MLISLICRKVLDRDGSEMPHQMNWAQAMAEGLQRHGVAVEIIKWGQAPKGDIVGAWGWMIGKQFVGERRVIIAERGYVGDRREWTSIGFDGLNGRAKRPIMNDSGKRWAEHFGSLLQSWRNTRGYCLIAGQVAGDQAVAGVNLDAWYKAAAAAMIERGYDVIFRPHPESAHHAPRGIPILNGDLIAALAGAAIVTSYNSNLATDAALAGVPVIACDRGSMAWPVAAHGLDAPIVRPDRSEWCAQLAWAQFTKAEFASGMAWEHLRNGL